MAVPVAGPDQAPLKFQVNVAQFKLDTKVSDVDLDSAMLNQSGYRSHYGAQAAYAEAQAAREKIRFEVKEAALYDSHRKAMVLVADKVTEKAIENAVKLDKKWGAGKERVIDAELIAAVNKALVEGLKDRRDMIIQLGADRRDESKGAARVMAAKDAATELSNRALEAAKR